MRYHHCHLLCLLLALDGDPPEGGGPGEGAGARGPVLQHIEQVSLAHPGFGLGQLTRVLQRALATRPPGRLLLLRLLQLVVVTPEQLGVLAQGAQDVLLLLGGQVDQAAAAHTWSIQQRHDASIAVYKCSYHR